MKPLSLPKYLYLAYLSRPAADRSLYRLLRRQSVSSIVEIGIGRGTRVANLIAVLRRFHPGTELRYTGIDLFEARPANCPGLTLKEAHKQLKPLAERVQLAPGDAYMGLARLANTLPNTDLLLISAGQDPASLARAWTFVPRMLHPGSLVFREVQDTSGGAVKMQPMTLAEIERLAGQTDKAVRRAA